MKNWDWATLQEGGFDPHMLTLSSARNAHWIYQKCPKKQLCRRMAMVSAVCLGRGCPCCQGWKVWMCKWLQLVQPNVAAKWDLSHNISTTNAYPAQSTNMAWWYNSKRGSFEATITSRTRTKMGRQQVKKHAVLCLSHPTRSCNKMQLSNTST